MSATKTRIPNKGGDGVTERGGVIISHKEMYKAQQEVVQSLHRLETRMESRLDVLESKVESGLKADERSREALEKAENAHRRIKRIEDKTDKILVGVIMALAGGAIAALFYFAQIGMGLGG